MAAVDNIFLTGKVASLFIERTDTLTPVFLPCTSVAIATKIDTPDASNYNGLGYTILVDGIQSAEITVEAVYDKTQMPVIFAGMKANLKLSQDGNRTAFLATNPTATQSTLGTNEYQVANNAGADFLFENCTVTQVTYDVAVKDVQKIKLTLIPSSTPDVNFADFSV